jgi:hypothetical protein
MTVESWLRPRQRVLDAIEELEREKPRLGRGGGGRDNKGADDDGDGDDDDDDDDDDDEFDEEERMADLCLEHVKTVFVNLQRDMDRLSKGELKFAPGLVMIGADGSLICEEYELFGEDLDEDDSEELVERLQEHLDATGKSVAVAARQMRRAPATLYAWLAFRTEPSPSSCERLEKYLAKWE